MQGRRVAAKAGLRRDVPHRAPFRTCAEQSALGAAQHLDAIEIENRGQGVVGVKAERAHLDRRIVDVDAGGARARLRNDAADGHVMSVAIKGDARCELRQIGHRLDALDRHFLPGEGAHAFGYGGKKALAARGRNHQLCDLAGRADFPAAVERRAVAGMGRSAPPHGGHTCGRNREPWRVDGHWESIPWYPWAKFVLKLALF